MCGHKDGHMRRRRMCRGARRLSKLGISKHSGIIGRGIIGSGSSGSDPCVIYLLCAKASHNMHSEELIEPHEKNNPKHLAWMHAYIYAHTRTHAAKEPCICINVNMCIHTTYLWLAKFGLEISCPPFVFGKNGTYVSVCTQTGLAYVSITRALLGGGQAIHGSYLCVVEPPPAEKCKILARVIPMCLGSAPGGRYIGSEI